MEMNMFAIYTMNDTVTTSGAIEADCLQAWRQEVDQAWVSGPVFSEADCRFSNR